jgi:hypothetical protein
VASVLEAVRYHTVATKRRCASQQNCALMSQMGHERRFRDFHGTSALPPILTVRAGMPDRQLGAITGCEQSQQNSRYSITSSARASNMGGTVRPSALAVVRSMTRSKFVEARRMRVCYPSRPSARMVSCTFGLAPIRAMYALMFGHFARSILWILVQLSTVNR